MTMHIDIDWDEREVLAAISLLGLLIAETGKRGEEVANFDEIARAAHMMADDFMAFDSRYKRSQWLDRRLKRGEIDEEEYKTAKQENRE